MAKNVGADFKYSSRWGMGIQGQKIIDLAVDVRVDFNYNSRWGYKEKRFQTLEWIFKFDSKCN